MLTVQVTFCLIDRVVRVAFDAASLQVEIYPRSLKILLLFSVPAQL